MAGIEESVVLECQQSLRDGDQWRACGKPMLITEQYKQDHKDFYVCRGRCQDGHEASFYRRVCDVPLPS